MDARGSGIEVVITTVWPAILAGQVRIPAFLHPSALLLLSCTQAVSIGAKILQETGLWQGGSIGSGEYDSGRERQ